MGNAAVVQALRRRAHPGAAGHEDDVHSVGGQTTQTAVQRSSAVHDVLRAPGRPLSGDVRADMEARLGADFSDVRIHDGSSARASAAALGARAYTSGSHVVIGEGGGDKHTLAHELTHVIQQRQGEVAGTEDGDGLKVSDPSDRFERAAEATARRVMAAPAGGNERRGEERTPNPRRGAGGGAAVQLAGARLAGDATAAADLNSQLTSASIGSRHWAQPEDPPLATTIGPVVGAGLGTVTSAAALVGHGMALHNGLKAQEDAKKDGKDTAQLHAAKRDVAGATGGVAEQAAGFTNMSVGLAGAALTLLKIASKDIVSSVSSGAGIVGTSIQTARLLWKTKKADQRVQALKKAMNDEAKPAQALQAAEKEVAEARAFVDICEKAAEAGQNVFNRERQEQARQKADGKEVDEVRLAQLEAHAAKLREALDTAKAAVETAERSKEDRKLLSERIQAALHEQTVQITRYEKGEEAISLHQIREYALKKNRRGRARKAIGAISGLLGIGGSAAALVAAVTAATGAGVLVASPVGWGLAAAAALVALGVGAWKTWQYFSHRMDQIPKQDAGGRALSTRERIGRLLGFGKGKGTKFFSEREKIAAALYEMARDDSAAMADRCREARETLVTLGLTWEEMAGENQRAHGEKLIVAKLAST